MDTVTFGTKNSYADFGLILSSKSVSLPKAKTKTVEVPGADGVIDLTEILSNDVKFGNRKLQFTFTVVDHFNGWAARLSEVANYLHGKKMKVYMDWDKQFYYEGRCTVNSFKSKKRTATIVIDVDADPWKYERNSAYQMWTWDDFSFLDGIIRKNEFEVVKGSNYLTLINQRKPVSPTITCHVNMTVGIGEQSFILQPGTTTLTEAKLVEGTNFISIESAEADTITITYKGGSL